MNNLPPEYFTLSCRQNFLKQDLPVQKAITSIYDYLYKFTQDGMATEIEAGFVGKPRFKIKLKDMNVWVVYEILPIKKRAILFKIITQ